jgi:hypothetical protein
VGQVSFEAKEDPKQPTQQQPLTASPVAGPVLLAPALDSTIVTNFPAIFDEFRGKRFSLLWRGGRDGFGAKDFHRRCDWHANTLTLIEDTDGNIFGGFMPSGWESDNYSGPEPPEPVPEEGTDWCLPPDGRLKSFIFTLKNPHDVLPQRFAVGSNWAATQSSYGPVFQGAFGAIWVYDNCNANTNSWARLKLKYISLDPFHTIHTALDGSKLFTGSEKFQVKEIEVFEITDETAPNCVFDGSRRFVGNTVRSGANMSQIRCVFCHELFRIGSMERTTFNKIGHIPSSGKVIGHWTQTLSPQNSSLGT